MFGGKFEVMLTGSAAISKEVVEFMQIAMCVPFCEAYGQTETGGASTFTDVEDIHAAGTVGSVKRTLDMKVIDVPELEYYHNDEVDGVNHPRGELCFRGNTLFSGYLCNPEKTAEAVDEDGWLHTGDIGEILPNGSVKIIDRKNDIFKLNQGEYIAPQRLESIFCQIDVVQQVFIYGDALQTTIVAVIVPDKDALVSKGHCDEEGYETYATGDEFKNLVTQKIAEQKAIHKVSPY